MRGARLACHALLLGIFSLTAMAAEKSWIITLEEPTGIYRRDNEVVTVKLGFAPGEAIKDKLRIVSPDGRAIPCQIEVEQLHPDGSIKAADLMFAATLVPGERPQYRLIALAAGEKGGWDESSNMIARRIGIGRIEMANDRFGVVLNLGLEGTEPAIVSAFNKSAGEARMLNLVDLSPDVKQPLALGVTSAGFGTMLGKNRHGGAFSGIEILEAGPFRGKVRLAGARLGDSSETWEFIWHLGSPVLRWKATLDRDSAGSEYGYFFSSLSAVPYAPFDRWIDGAEDRFPDGWETDNPPDQLVGAANLPDLPGGHILYYQRKENYGALGFYELDKGLRWEGIGAAQFYAVKPLTPGMRGTEIALSFPRWKGTESVLEARRDYRCYTQPILSVVKPAGGETTGQAGAVATERPVTSQAVSVRPISELNKDAADQVQTLDLNGQWKLNWAEKSDGEKRGFQLRDFPDSSWQAVRVPGTVHTQILEAPKFYTKEADWISEKEWWYRRSFRIPDSVRGRRLRLQFGATDYYADIWLNGQLLGRHEGYIDPYELEIGGAVDLKGENQLAVRVWTPVSYYWRHRPYTIKGSYGAVDQKPDNITAIGITRPVRVLAGGPIIIRESAVDTRFRAGGSADVLVDLTLDPGGRPGTTAEVILRLTPRNFQEPEGLELRSTVRPGASSDTRRFVLHVQKPQLWWTWDHGKPNLYTLDIQVRAGGQLSDRQIFAIGLREIEHVDWKFYLNGRRMFVRGTNSYYNLFLSEMRRSDYERDLGLMRSMNINMVRLHCHFSNPEFYDLADELGLLIWQDYLEAWYPEDPDFGLMAARLFDPHIRYVRNHPSVSVWATSDEESLENYRWLTKHLEPRLYALDPQRRPVVRSTGRYGDGHIYYGWYGGSIWQYTKMTEKFVSELGATALPNYESLIKFLPDAWPIREHREEWIFHKLQIPEAMRAWGNPGTMTLREYIPQTQAYVARLFQLAIERMRRLKYQPAGGILHFHAIDIWPSVTMAAIDFYRQPTKAFSTVQQSFQMVLPSFAYDRDTWKSGEALKAELWLINDHWFDLPATSVDWQLENSKGEVVASDGLKRKVDLPADSAFKLMDVSLAAGAPGDYRLRARILDRESRLLSQNTYEFKIK